MNQEKRAEGELLLTQGRRICWRRGEKRLAKLTFDAQVVCRNFEAWLLGPGVLSLVHRLVEAVFGL